MPQRAHEFSREITLTRTVSLEYLLFLPEGYEKEEEKEWPLILFLHGAGERGSDLEKVTRHGIPKIVGQQPDFPFVAVSPQCPRHHAWSMDFILEGLVGLLDEVEEAHRIDAERIYLTGLSMGGFGTWALAERLPDRFAAIAPICGGGRPENVGTIAHIPTRIFHGGKDETVEPEESERMYEALKKCGADVEYTVYPQAGHDSWTETYDNPKLYEWFLSNCRKKGS